MYCSLLLLMARMAMIMGSGLHIICITVAFVLKWRCFVVALDGGLIDVSFFFFLSEGHDLMHDSAGMGGLPFIWQLKEGMHRLLNFCFRRMRTSI
jgi:hypothetical protein